jgi:hypothetical protein
MVLVGDSLVWLLFVGIASCFFMLLCMCEVITHSLPLSAHRPSQLGHGAQHSAQATRRRGLSVSVPSGSPPMLDSQRPNRRRSVEFQKCVVFSIVNGSSRWARSVYRLVAICAVSVHAVYFFVAFRLYAQRAIGNPSLREYLLRIAVSLHCRGAGRYRGNTVGSPRLHRQSSASSSPLAQPTSPRSLRSSRTTLSLGICSAGIRNVPRMWTLCVDDLRVVASAS